MTDNTPAQGEARFETALPGWQTVSLYQLAHARAGDKGNRSNISVIPYIDDVYPQLVSQLTESVVLDVFRHRGATAVKRYELPRLPALNFVIDNVLEGGVNDGLGLDGHGKALSFLLLESLTIEVPVEFLQALDQHRNRASNHFSS